MECTSDKRINKNQEQKEEIIKYCQTNDNKKEEINNNNRESTIINDEFYQKVRSRILVLVGKEVISKRHVPLNI
jgi:hypothetical protein